MIPIGYPESINSQRGKAQRCENSRRLASFLGDKLDQATPDPFGLTVMRRCSLVGIPDAAFRLALEATAQHGLFEVSPQKDP